MRITKIGNKEIPEFRLSTTLFGDIKTLYEKFGSNEVDLGVAAEILGHKSPASGTFKAKIASMRDYGLIDGRGKIRVAEIGQKIAYHKTDEEFNDALIRAVNKIPLWHELFEKFTAKDLDLPDADFWLEIKDSSDLTIEQAKTIAPDVRNSFKEDFKMIRVPKPLTSPMGQQSQVQQQPQSQSQTVPEGMIPIGFGDTKVFLPKERTEEAWKKLKALVDAYVEA